MSYEQLDNKELHFSTEPNIAKNEEWFVALGSILSSYNGDYINTFDTRYSLESLSEGLSSMWGITDKTSFDKVANWLINEGQRTKYLPRLVLVKKFVTEVNNVNGFLKALFKILPRLSMIYYQIKTKTDFRQNIKELDMDQLDEEEKNGTFANMLTTGLYCSTIYKQHMKDYLDIQNLLAWDSVRLVNICRWAMLVGYISREESIRYMNQIKSQIQMTYCGWDEVATAYAVAGILWSPSEERADALAVSIGKLLNDKRSLINQCDFRCG